MNHSIIDVIYITHGRHQGGQAQFNPDSHIWTVWTEKCTELTFNNVSDYARFMVGG